MFFSKVDAVSTELRSRGIAAARILDLGTGTGAIAVALATALPQCWIVATDVSLPALELATRNAQRARLDLAAAGVPLAFGSDSPVTPVDPWAGVRAAVEHTASARSRTSCRLSGCTTTFASG